MNNLKGVLTSRISAIMLLILTTIWDCWGTCATIGHKLHLDGNPFIRNFNWVQVIILQLVVGIIITVFFLLAWRKEEKIWPIQKMKFMSFFGYRLKNGFALKFSWEHIKTESIYGAFLLIWVVIFAHLLASIITTSPLLGGPSFLDVARSIGLRDLRFSQRIVTMLILTFSIVLAHYPMYWRYCLGKNKKEI